MTNDYSPFTSAKLAPVTILTIYADDGRPIVQIWPDGRMELDPAMTATEQAKAFWDALKKYIEQSR